VLRREFLVSLSALALAPPRAIGQTPAAAIKTRALNHVTITVADVKRSVDFYQRVFGMPVQARQAAIVVLRVGSGPQSHIIAPAGSNGVVGINHFCLTVDGFDANKMLKTVTDLGATGGRIRMRGAADGGGGAGAPDGTPELTFRDPDNILVQIQDVGYCGGAGIRGDVCPAPVAAPTKALIPVRTLSHVTLTVTDTQRSVGFYQKIFGMPIQTRQGPTVLLSIGAGPAFVAFGGSPKAKPAIGHLCFTIDNFEPNRIMKTLADAGVKEAKGPGEGPMTAWVRQRGPENNGGGRGAAATPELYFTDPDNLMMQLQDVRYCGGSGFLGEVCP
jgi:catechol 2,3-dioxygenase-like lactoylglutathione lyase family enzyme